MTEAEWLACADAWTMLEFLRTEASKRKLRLFACACFQHVHEPMAREDIRQAWEIALRHADGKAGDKELLACFPLAPYRPDRPDRDEVFESMIATTDVIDHKFGWDESRGDWKAGYSSQRAHKLLQKERAAQAELARCIFGNPFRPGRANRAWLAWNNGTIPKLAQVIYHMRAFDRLPILADALEEAGCTDEAILSHCRGPGPHARGCFVVDLLLAKE